MRRIADGERTGADGVEIRRFVRIEIEGAPGRPFQRIDARSSSVKLDRAQLYAGDRTGGIFDAEIVLGIASLSRNGEMPDLIAERPGIMFPEETIA